MINCHLISIQGAAELSMNRENRICLAWCSFAPGNPSFPRCKAVPLLSVPAKLIETRQPKPSVNFVSVTLRSPEPKANLVCRIGPWE